MTEENSDALAVCEAASQLGCNMYGSVARCVLEMKASREHYASQQCSAEFDAVVSCGSREGEVRCDHDLSGSDLVDCDVEQTALSDCGQPRPGCEYAGDESACTVDCDVTKVHCTNVYNNVYDCECLVGSQAGRMFEYYSCDLSRSDVIRACDPAG